MLDNKDSSSNSRKKDSKRGYFFSLFYVTLFGLSFLSGTMLGIPSISQSQTQTQPGPVSLGVQDVYAQEYKDQKDSYYSNSYDKGYDSYDKKKVVAELEKFDNKLFICDNGIVVDDRINCPQKCPFNTPLEGVYVMDLDVCNIQPGVGVTCPENTDLPGVVVTNVSQCNIFFECDATTPLGVSLQGQDVKVADPALCELSSIANLQVCASGPFEGFVVTEEDVCDAMEGVEVCAPGTDLQGMLTTNPLTCDIFEECVTGDPIFTALPPGEAPFPVVDETICQLTVPEGVDLFPCGADTENPFAVVTDLQLCDAPGDGNICPLDTDLPGVYVSNINTQCNIFEECETGDPIFGLIADTPGGDSPFDVVDSQICQIAAPEPEPDGGAEITLETCPEDSLLPGINVTDTALCNVVDEDLKECQICGVLRINELFNTITTTTLRENILSYINTENGKGGLLGICTSDDPIAAYATLLEDEDIFGGLRDTIMESFTNCLNAAGITAQSVAGEQLSVNDKPLQTSNTQISQESKISSQNTEVNKNIELEQTKKAPVLPLFNFNTK